MTTFADHTHRLAVELTHLAVARSSAALDGRGLDVAISGRAATLQLLRTVHADVTGVPDAGSSTAERAAGRAVPARAVDRVQAHPVAALSLVLADHPLLVPDRSTMSALAAASSTVQTAAADRSAVQAWAQVGRHAVLAADQWENNPSQVTDAQRWSAVADIASLAGTVAVLDHHLLTAARALAADGDQHPMVEPLTRAATSGLQVTAREALHLASTGPLPPWGDPGPEIRRQGLMLVTSAQTLAEAHRRLPGQIRGAVEVSPRATATVLAGQTRLLAAAATTLRQVDPQRARLAYELGAALRSLPALDRSVVSLTAGDRRALHQTAELVQHLARAQRADPRLVDHRAALATIVDQTPRVLTAAADHVARSVRSGHWLVRDHDAAPDRPLWRTASPAHGVPELASRMQAVAARATTAAAFPSPAAPTPASSRPSPREVVQAAGDLLRPAPARPVTPSSRPDPGIGRG